VPHHADMKKRSRALIWIGLFGAGLLAAHYLAPPRLLPWKPLVLADSPGFWTNWKLSVLAEAPQTCRQVLREGNVAFTPIADGQTGEACGFDNAMLANRVAIPLAPASPKLACPMVAGLDLWLRDVVQPAAKAHFGQTVKSVQHFGTYSCRNVAGTSRRSEHATANAMDIAAFTLADGRVISVLKDWSGKPDAQAFLREVRDGACDIFSVMLSPDYNAAHHDHFHVDLGLWQRCG
jgi:hypothetical protein